VTFATQSLQSAGTKTGAHMNQRAIDDERALRFALWGELQAHGGPDSVLPRTLQQLRVYGGARGIWVDKVRTRDISDDGAGVTVALLHTGTVYDDDLSDDGVIYHYPSTETSGWDHAQVAATKNAARLRVPVFVISRSASHRDLREVRTRGACVLPWAVSRASARHLTPRLSVGAGTTGGNTPESDTGTVTSSFHARAGDRQPRRS